MLSVDEKYLRVLQEREDAPESMDLGVWTEWLQGNGLAKAATRATYSDLREQKIKEEIELLRLKKRKEEGKSIAMEDVLSYLGRLAAKWDQLLTQKIDVEVPARLQGKDIVAARAEALAIHDEIREVCNAGIVAAGKDLTE